MILYGYEIEAIIVVLEKYADNKDKFTPANIPEYTSKPEQLTSEMLEENPDLEEIGESDIAWYLHGLLETYLNGNTDKEEQV